MTQLCRFRVVLCAWLLAAPLSAQQLQLADRGPRFLSTPHADEPAEDVSRAPVFRRRATLELNRVTLVVALDALAARTGIRFSYSPAVLPTDKLVSVSATDITVGGALHEILFDTDLDIQLRPNGLLALMPRPRAGVIAARSRQTTGWIAGRVIDAKTGQGLPGATVVVEASSYRVVAKNDGQYTIRGIPLGSYVVTARVLGYAPSTRRVAVVDSTAHVDFALSQTAATLEEVVTTGAGPQRRIELGNSIATIHADSVVKTAPVTNLTDVLSGRAPGVDVVQTNGMAGSGPAIRIRGRGSVTLSNDPIYIVDGVRMNGSPGGTVDAFANTVGITNNPTASRLNDIDPDEIETIEVLRGPSASTEYGTDAANGVVVITTKRGRAGAARWSATAEEDVSKMPVRFPGNYYSWGHTTDASHTSTMCPLVPNLRYASFGLPGYGFGSAVGTCAVDSVTRWQPLNHYETSLFGTGNRSHYELQVSGGAGQTSYFLGGGLTSEIGALQMPNTEAARLARERGEPVPRDQLRPNAVDDKGVRARIATAFGGADLTATATYVNNAQRSPDQNSLLLAGLVAAGIRDSLSGYAAGTGAFLPTATVPGVVLATTGTEGVSRFTGGLSGVVRSTEWLTGRGTVGLDNANQSDQVITVPGQGLHLCGDPACNTFGQLGYRSLGLYRTDLYTVDLGATATAALTSGVSSKAAIGMQYNDRRTSGSAVAVSNLALGNPTLNGATELSQLERGEEATTLGSYVEETIGFAERLFLVGAIRVDAGSGFGKSYKAAAYPKASASWVVLPEGRHVSLRLRGAYGQSGVQPPPGSTVQLYVPMQTYTAGGPVSSVVLSTIGTPGLRPERTAEEEGGFDLGLFRQRLTLEATGYAKLSHDALVSIPIAGSLGGGAQLINLGSVRNRGIEMSITARVLDTRPAQWDVTVSGSDNEDRLVTLGRGVSPIDQTSFFLAPYKQQPGYPLYGLWAYRLHYNDLNHDGIIEANEVTLDATPSFIGPSLAPRELAVNSGLTLFGGRLRLGGQVDHRGGQYLTNIGRQEADGYQHSRATNDRRAPLWEQARAVEAINDPLGRTSSAYVEPASFTRLRELSLTYAAPVRLAAALRARTLSVTIAGRNLALWTKYTGADPEVSTAGGVNQITSVTGVPTTAVNPDIVGDDMSVPEMRYWTLKVNVGL